MPARLHWNPLPQAPRAVDMPADAIVDARRCTVQLENGFLYLDAAADAEHCLLGHDEVEPVAAGAGEVAALIEALAPGYRCVALADGLAGGLAAARFLASDTAKVVDALTGFPATTRPLIAVENQSLGRSGAWLASLGWPRRPSAIVIGEALAAGAPFAAVLVRDDAAGSADRVVSAGDAALSRVAGTIAAAERGGVVSDAGRLATYFSQRLASLVESDGAALTVTVLPLAARIAFKTTSAPLMKRKLCERGVLVGLDDTAAALVVLPPLIMRPAEIDVIIGTLRGALNNVPAMRASACCAACQAIAGEGAIGPAY
jgi:adenosylmethionine-8-amino-7-oxononanoate aminotransferase